jgi:hypothetical protein
MSKNGGKRKERKAVIEKYLGGLFARTEGYARNVSRYYTAAVEALLDLAATADMKPDEVFRFSDHKRMSVKATNILRGLYSAVYQEIRRGVTAEWEYANLSADAMITSLFGKGVMEDNHFARWFARNQEAMDSFFSRKDAHGGLNLSQKVWKYTGQLKEEMELALSASLGQGDSASTVSRHVRQYLREPDRLFRRVRDAQGNLNLSKRAAAYHPGRGEYRSSYKNAMRLTRTETNMAYRAADCDRWSRIPFVVGMEVKRSNHPFGCEVCEALKGKYPKDFVFTGWHPQCRCYIVPVLASEEERMAYHRAVLNGEDVSDFHLSGEVTDVPDGMKKWVKENAERIENAKSLPYWVRDNGKYVGAGEQLKHKAESKTVDTSDILDKLSHATKPTENKLYVSFEPFSPIIINYVNAAKSRREKNILLESIMNDERGKVLNDVNGIKTIEFPGHQGKRHSNWSVIKESAFHLNNDGISVAFLPERTGGNYADSLLRFNKKRYVIADFKSCTTLKYNTLAEDLIDGFVQANYIVLENPNMDAGMFKSAIKQVVRKTNKYGNIILINKYGKHIEISRRDIKIGRYKLMIKGFL